MTMMMDSDISNSDEVSIFCCDIAKQSEESLVRNVQKKARALMLPGVLRCLGTAEYQGQIFIATDKCISLKTLLSQKNENRFYKIDAASNGNDDDSSSSSQTTPEEKFQVAVAYGVNTIASAISSLHKNKLFHGCVNIDSIFVLQDSGEWRLFGFEYATTFDDVVNGTSSFNRSSSRVLHPHRLAPEAGGIGGANSKIAESGVALLDSWGLGILLFEVFHFHSSQGGASSSFPTNANDLRSPKCLPRDFLSSYSVLVTSNAKLRWTPERFRNEAEIIHGSSKIVRLMTELEQLTLKDNVDRDTYYRELATCVDACPTKLATGLMLPKIANLIQYGGCSAAALVPLLKIARKLSTEAFGTKVAPSVLVMFNSPEPLVRMKLLENAELYAPLLPEKLVCAHIWPLYQAGLNHKIPELRELSIRSLVHFAPVLTERFTSGDIVKSLLALQQDPQGVIRTNSTICLGMLARFLPSESRGKTLCSGFGRMLKDPYAPSRAAAVRSISSLAEETFSAAQICEQLLPALCPMLLDTDKSTRDAATTCVQKLVARGVALAHEVPCAAPQPAMQQHSSGSNNNNSTTITTQQQQSSPAPTTSQHHIKSFSSSSNNSSSQVSTPTASVHHQNNGSNNNNTVSNSAKFSSQTLNITPPPKKIDPFADVTPPPAKLSSAITTSKTTTATAGAPKSMLLTKGWDNIDDEDSDEEFKLANSSSTTAVTASSPAPAMVLTTKKQPEVISTTTTTPTIIPISTKKKDDFVDSLNDTTNSGGGAMKLGGTVSSLNASTTAAPKKRGFGVKKGAD